MGFDEIQSMSFVQPTQIQTALKDYMEVGEVQGFDASIVADAGIIVLSSVNRLLLTVSMVSYPVGSFLECIKVLLQMDGH